MKKSKTQRSNARNQKLRDAGGRHVLYAMSAEQATKLDELKAKIDGIKSHQAALDYCLNMAHDLMVVGCAP